MIHDGIEKRDQKNSQLRRNIDKLIYDGHSFLKQNLLDLDVHDYHYIINEAIEELGLDHNIVIQLLEDYIIQILKAKVTFLTLINDLKNEELKNLPLDYTELRDLAHKNLGVARNLRIVDAQKILTELLKKDDLDYLLLCVKALEVSAVKLNPLCAYETLNLIEVKNSI
ncbi:hypothetical protein N9A28_00035 [Sulfurimonas sp.]|nr:hypothetical protein [Sulfurimonas sp.]